MFLNQLKDFLIKNKVKKRLSNVTPDFNSNPIKTVGIIFDETHFEKKVAILNELQKKGIPLEKISVLIFNTIAKKNQAFEHPTFSPNDFTLAANFKNPDVNEFISKKFDLLINYYDIEKAALLQVSNLSKASFKVGFSAVDKRINHFMINTTTDNYKVFIDELFKYLKILNKI